MKKKFNKKKLLTFGIIGLFSLVLVSAALVGYLSNKVTADVTIKSPIVIEISEDGASWSETNTITFADMYTGGNNVVTFYTKEENLANEKVIGDTENIVYNSGITCGDFESVIVSSKAVGDDAYYWTGDVTSLCVQPDGENYVTFTFVGQDWDAGQIEINEIVVTFNDVKGKYTFTSQIVPTA